MQQTDNSATNTTATVATRPIQRLSQNLKFEPLSFQRACSSLSSSVSPTSQVYITILLCLFVSEFVSFITLPVEAIIV